jgi:SAM-dependent methyltransferase
MKLNLGAGYTKLDGYVTIDHDKLTNPDYLCDIEKENWPLEDNTLTDVRAHHILEHIGEGFLHVMKELYRVCKDGAVIDIAVPHPRHDDYLGDPTHRRFVHPMMLRQFSKKYCDWHKNFHGSSSGFAPRLNVDFEIFEVNYSVDDDYVKMQQEGKHEEIEALAKKFNNVYKYIYIRLLVIKD